ncbi:hypothetical protein [Vibrio aquimaris]|uniref:Uncharacterized protein n=1 Tax=Vibrio aquimaris TaxID=2587862 RepID=A0A5P9CR77_9VIBR|nr:hypothetical protein [Vibrio aquimaris]QFT28769.1 hypothetical protein FIV01_20420 [Vibrio aquimaris]
MITNNITNALLGSIEHTTPQVAPENVEAYLTTIKKAERDLEKIDPAIALLDKQPADSEILAMVAAHQKQVVQSMVSSNPEDAIALALASSIEAYSQQLEIIYGWTNGGVEMFESALWLMLEGIEADGVQPEELEDLFQIALLDIMIHPEKYGLENWYAANKEDISHILESTGSGSHGLHESDYDTPEELAEVTKSLYEGIMNNATIPEGSLLDEVMSALEGFEDADGATGSDALYSQINDHYYDDYGWWTEGTADDLSPMLRLFLLSEVLSNNPKMSQEDVELILTGSLTEIDDLIKKTFGSGTALEFLCDNTTWQIQTGYNYPDGKTTQIDWKGDGIDNNDLDDLYNNFEGRDLTDEDIEEINRIGDQVKMLQQTLKYWLQICRDEQMAIARNI